MVTGRAAKWLAAMALVPGVALADPPRPASSAPAMPRMAGDQPESAEDEAMGARLQQALRSHGGDVYGCYDKAQRDDRKVLTGELLVRLWVAPGGAVSRVDLLKDEVGSASLGDCLSSTMRGWRVPELAGADVRQIVFPLVFKPEANGSADGAQVAAPRYVIPLAEGKPGPIGRGTVEARVLIDPVTVGSTRASLTHLVLRQSARLAPHSHPGVLELLYVMKGLARVRTAEKGVVLNAVAGDLIVVPPSGLHSIEAAPLAPLTLIQMFAPGGPEHAYRDPSDRSGTQPGAGSAKRGEKATDPPVVMHAAELRTFPIAGGKGRVQLFLDGLPVGDAAVEQFEAEAGAEVPLHKHDDSDENLFILAGRGTMEVQGQQLTVAANDAVHLPAGTLHSLRVVEKLVAVQCYAPGGPEQRFKKATPVTPRETP